MQKQQGFVARVFLCSGSIIPSASEPWSFLSGALDAGNVMRKTRKKLRRYLWLASENERRASETSHLPLKTLFLELASEYRNLAEQKRPRFFTVFIKQS